MIKVQRISVRGELNPQGDAGIPTPPTKDQRTWQRRGGKDCKSPRSPRIVAAPCLLYVTGKFSHELNSCSCYSRPAHDPSSHLSNSSNNWGVHKAPLLGEKPQAVDGC